MSDFSGVLLWDIGLPLLLVGILVGLEWLLEQLGKRFWMWALGAVWIAFVIWYRGPADFFTWIIVVGWLGLLAWFDVQMRKPHQVSGQ